MIYFALSKRFNKKPRRNNNKTARLLYIIHKFNNLFEVESVYLTVNDNTHMLNFENENKLQKHKKIWDQWESYTFTMYINKSLTHNSLTGNTLDAKMKVCTQ